MNTRDISTKELLEELVRRAKEEEDGSLDEGTPLLVDDVTRMLMARIGYLTRSLAHVNRRAQALEAAFMKVCKMLAQRNDLGMSRVLQALISHYEAELDARQRLSLLRRRWWRDERRKRDRAEAEARKLRDLLAEWKKTSLQIGQIVAVIDNVAMRTSFGSKSGYCNLTVLARGDRCRVYGRDALASYVDSLPSTLRPASTGPESAAKYGVPLLTSAEAVANFMAESRLQWEDNEGPYDVLPSADEF